MLQPNTIEGVIPAVLLPRDTAGNVDWGAFEQNIEFLLGFDVTGVCVNGATGEYVHATASERRESVRIARRLAGASRLVVSGAGAAVWRDVLALAADSEDAGADALLIPAPHFFRYSQDDLAEFFARTVERRSVPVLIYNLAAFAGGIEPQISVRLIEELEGIAGIKDSSGQLTTLAALSEPGRAKAVRLVGHDGVLAEAIDKGLCDGAISGVAGVLPELTLGLWKCGTSGDSPRFRTIAGHLRKLLDMLDSWPVPWALKIIADCRGLAAAEFALPLSARRREQMAGFRREFAAWWALAHVDVESAMESPVVPGR